MYDNHIFCKEYRGLKSLIADILNGDDTSTDIYELEAHIQNLYNEGMMPSHQYDDLMSYIQDME